MDNRYYLQALVVTGLFIGLMVLFWIGTGGLAASQAEVENANSTRTAIAMTASYLLNPRTRTPSFLTISPTPALQTSEPASTPTSLILPSATNTSLLSQLNTPIPPLESSITPLPTQTALPPPQLPTFTATVSISTGRLGTKPPAVLAPSGTPVILQGPAEFARWYFTRVWNERDYQNLWDNYLTVSFKTNVGSGLFEDYVWWWNTVERVEIHSVDVLENNGTNAWVRVNLTFHMKDGRVIQNQIYDYDFLYDSTRATWMFDASG